MTAASLEPTSPARPLRLWPGVAAVAVQWLAWVGVPLVAPAYSIQGFLVAMACGVLVLAWWLFFSRAPWLDRLGAVAVLVAAVWLTLQLAHESIVGGMMGWLPMMFSIPLFSLGLVAGMLLARRRSPGARRAATAAAIVAACGSLTLVRTGGVTGEGTSDLHWRWTPTPEDRLLAAPPPAPPPVPFEPVVPAVPAGAAATAAATGEAPATGVAAPAPTLEWPGFRGPRRDGVVAGVRIDTDWTRRPPAEIWRRAIGPGWSSFAVGGGLIYTQEQRGDEELVSAYRLDTGAPAWQHRDPVRFWESNAGAGPRATPTLAGGRVYTLGATGLVNALDAATGRAIWTRDASADAGRQAPDWGFASSPLVVGDVVVVAAAGRLVGYERESGHPRWLGPEGGGGYSSPHLATIDGVAQVLLLRGSRTTSVSPADGSVLWESTGPVGVSIVQPAFAAAGDVLIAPGDATGGVGIRRVTVSRGPAGWSVEDRWTSRGLKPYFNDFVVHEGHAYGFDGSILSAIDLAGGERKWKGGRYGHGQLLLLADQGLLLVLSEEGELVLVRAAPDRHTELARVPAIQGKTWNHPVVAGDVLLVRNGEEMAAFRLPVVR